ncbi:MAG: aminotransferase class III-fold pyridoxal phosphate-dependent enzyme [Alphaproteobacteria bacterium]
MDPIAIIGIGCRFPQADTPAAFWQLLRNGVDAIKEVPADRWDVERFFDPDPETPGRMNTRWGGFLDHVDRFDPEFFGISPREACSMDPQQRLLLEVVWEALEDAGLPRQRLAGTRTGVFIGISNFDYSRLLGHDPQAINAYTGPGTALSIAANRISYLWDFRGPSLALDTACSSSLVAVHVACLSLGNGESSLAVAGGVNVLLSPEPTIAFSEARMMADDGRCKTFDDRANGYVRGEGAGIVVLKPLSQALGDGDQVYAVIRGSAINQDGLTNGLTAPNPLAQEAVVREAYRQAGVSPGRVHFVEAHGTGTPLGDPLEVKALSKVLAADRPPGRYCAIGSVKTNIGHLESAAGIAGLIKVALSLRHRQIPANLHFQKANKYIPFDELPVRVQQTLGPWPETSAPAVASVSSFGFGGTNAHVVLEEAPPETSPVRKQERPVHILALSAKTANSLRTLAGRYDAFLGNRSEVSVADVCFAANTGRSHFPHRLAVIGETSAQLRKRLAAFAAGSPASSTHHGLSKARRRAPIVFLFPGQACHYPHMGRQLYETLPTFRDALNRCDERLRPYLERPLLTVLYPEADGSPLLDQTAYTQPALFALEYALSELWRSWGISPDVVMGHSVGEYTAACVAGALSLEDGLKFVADRGRLMQELPHNGMMAAVFADETRVEGALAELHDDVSIAAINGPENTVISGDRAAVETVLKKLKSKGVKARPLTVSHAFHSRLMEPVLGPLEKAASQLGRQPLRLPLVSNLTGEILQPGHIFDARYWRRHAREPVRFAAGMAALSAHDYHLFLELGPNPVLSAMGRHCLRDGSATWLASLRQGKQDWPVLLDSLAQLYVQGLDVDWAGLDKDYARKRLSLPSYPFDRKRYWVNVQTINQSRRASRGTMSEPQVGQPPGNARHEKIVSLIQTHVAKLLWANPSDVDRHTPFLELGADSLVLVDLVTTIESMFGVKLTIRELYENLTNIDVLSAHLDQALPPEWGIEDEEQSAVKSDDAARDADAGLGPSPDPLAAWSAQISSSNRKPESAAGADEEAPGTQRALERLINRQLDVLSRVMTQQLDALRSTGSSAEPLSPTRTGVTAAASDAVVAPASPPRGSSRGRAAPRASSDDTRKDEPTETSRERRSTLPAWRRRADSQATGLSPRQQRHLKALVNRYTRRTQGSKRFAERYRPALADTRASAGFRFSIKDMLYPIVGERARGARIWDVDGNEYVDLTMGFGVQLFGHDAPFIREALEQQLTQGLQLGPQAPLAGQVAEAVCDLTGMERVTFCNSGTEAVMTALRLARTATGRDTIALFAGSYHGHFDGTLALPQTVDGDVRTIPLSPGVTAHTVEDVLVLPYGEAESLEVLRARSHELAGVLVEPVQSRRPDFQPKEFLQEVRQLTKDTDVALIFDEILTGFRIHPGGAQAWFGVEADLATYGKLVGGGLPIGIVAGKAAFMDGIDGGMWSYGDASYPEAQTTFFAGTFNKNVLVMATARAVLREIKERGPALQEQLNQRTKQLADTLNDYFCKQNVPIRIVHFGSMFRFEFQGNMDLLFYHLLDRGVYVWEGRTCFLSTVHSDEDISHVVTAAESSVKEMREGGFVPAGPGSQGTAGLARSAGRSKVKRDKPVDLRADNLEVRLAEDRAEIDETLALRYSVFYEEMGAKPTPEMSGRRRDFDKFDDVCDHLLVIDHDAGAVVGTYRLLRREVATAHGGFYSANEYDIAKLVAYPGEILELGRTCVGPQYRDGTAMQLLWRGIAAYVRHYDIALMFGCAIFPGTDPQSLAVPLAYLYHYRLAPRSLRPRALPHRYVDMKLLSKAEVDPRRAAAELPALIKGYLRLGASVGDGAVIDDQFNSVDVCIVAKTDRVKKYTTEMFK